MDIYLRKRFHGGKDMLSDIGEYMTRTQRLALRAIVERDGIYYARDMKKYLLAALDYIDRLEEGKNQPEDDFMGSEGES